jgi:hypothetical protein
VKLAVLVLASRVPQAIPLLAAYFAGAGDVFVHVDAKTPDQAIPPAPGVRFVPRSAVFWGGWSMTLATFELIDAALAAGQYDRFLLISDDSAPLLPIERMIGALSEPVERIWITVEDDAWWHRRYDGYFFFDHPATSARHVPGPERRLDEALFSAMRDAKAMQDGRGKKKLALAHGPQWWALTRATIERVMDTHRADEWRRASFRFSAVSDEHYIQSIIGETSRQKFMLTERDGSVWPRVFRRPSEIDRGRAEGFLFLRKTDPDAPEMAELIRTGRWT